MDDKSPVITIQDSQRKNPRLRHSGTVRDRHRADQRPRCRKGQSGLPNVDLDDLTITGRDQNATFCAGGIGIRIRRNDIEAAQLLQTVSNTSSLGKTPLVFVRVGDVLIELNHCWRGSAGSSWTPAACKSAEDPNGSRSGGITSLAADNRQRIAP